MELDIIEKVVMRIKNDFIKEADPNCNPETTSFQDCLLDTDLNTIAKILFNMKDFDKFKIIIGLLKVHDNLQSDGLLYEDIDEDEHIARTAKEIEDIFNIDYPKLLKIKAA